MKAVIALFAYGDVKGETVASLVEEIRTGRDLILWVLVNDGLVSRCRSRAATRFLDEPDADVLVMLDHDMIWDTGDVAGLIERCRFTRGVVSGLYPRRAFGEGATARFLYSGTYRCGEDSLVEAAVVGGGFLAIHRDVLAAIAKELPTARDALPFFLPLLRDGAYWGEDYSFSLRARDAGQTVHLWLKPNIQHAGQYKFRMIDAANAPIPPGPVRLTVQHPVIADLPQDLAHYLNITVEEVGAGLMSGTRKLAQMWDRPADELAWYQRPEIGREYLFDLANWHMNGVGPTIQRHCQSLKGQRVLDYGAGIGTWSLMLADNGNDVDYVEPSDMLRRFIERRAERHAYRDRLKPVTSMQPASYDAVICWHVLEHVPDPENTVRQLARLLKPGGVAITQSDFHVGPLHPQHHVRPEGAADNMWRDAGLIPDGPDRFKKEIV